MSERLFVAVLPPAEVVSAWDAFLEPRRDAEPSFRWTVPDGWHLTLAFLPSVPPGRVEPLEEALGDVAARTPGFPVEVFGAGAFPNPNSARALWLGVSSGVAELSALATRCRNAASANGIEVEGGRFRGHLTLARTRPVSVVRWLRVLDALGPQSWAVADFALLRSRSLPGGAGYETLGRFPLGG